MFSYSEDVHGFHSRRLHIKTHSADRCSVHKNTFKFTFNILRAKMKWKRIAELDVSCS